MNVLFVCIGNQGRSVVAERLFRQAAGDRHEARSAGAAPGEATHPEVLAALSEACPVTPGKRRFDWHVRDPKGRPEDEVRAIRDEIDGRVTALLAEL